MQNGSLAAGQKTGVMVGFQAQNLLPGAYFDTLRVQSNDPDQPEVRVPVRMDVTVRLQPNIVVQPDSFRFSIAVGSADSAKWVIQNQGAAVLNWRMDGGTPNWISLTDTAGLVQPGDSAVVPFQVSAENLAAGVYDTTMLIKSNDPVRPQWPVHLKLQVYDPMAAFRVEPPEIHFNLAAGDSAAAPVWLINTSPLDAAWQAKMAAPWLRMPANSGPLAAGDSVEVLLSCVTAGLQPGVYTDTLRITIQTAPAQLRLVPVQLTVAGPSSTDGETAVPGSFVLLQNYPNPFNPETAIRFALPARADVVLTVYDLTGRRIRRLLAEKRTAGWHTVLWDARDDRGRTVGSGIYLYTLLWKDATGRLHKATRKMILMK